MHAPIDLASTSAFALGNLTVEPGLCCVRTSSGETSAVEPRVMQVLIALAKADAAVTSRRELEEQCWSGRTVGEDAINRVISRLRRLSEEIGEGQFRIETLPRVGYRLLCAPVRTAIDPVVAVLPFDIGAEGGERWFSDGISEGILHALATGSMLRVIGRSSSFEFRGAAKSISNIAATLQATHVLDGMVQRDGARTRISAHLIDTADRTTLWSERFDFTNTEPFAMQDAVAEKVALALDRTFAASSRPRQVEAASYDLYLRGAELTRDISPDSQRRAIALLEEAVRRMPGLADAWGTLALARAQASFFAPGPSASADEMRAGQADAARALALDPACRPAQLLPFVGGRLFDFSHHRKQFQAPEPAAFGRAASPDVSFGVQMLEVGRLDEALEFFEQAERFDPLFQIQQFYYALALASAGRIDEGLAKLDAAIERWPHVPFFAATRTRWAAASEDWDTVDRLMSPERMARFPLLHRLADVQAWVRHCRGETGDLLALRAPAIALNLSGLEELLLYARSVGLSQAIEALEAADQPLVNLAAPRRPDDPGTIMLFQPLYASVRADAGFQTLCERLGLLDQSL